MRFFLTFIFIWAIFSTLFFGYREITKSDVKITGKIIAAAIFAAVLSVTIFFLEYN